MQQVGKPVTGLNFIGRRTEIEQLKQYLLMGQSVVLIAPRRFGKTSLVLETIRQIKREGYYTAVVDIFSNPTLELFSKAIVSEVLENHKLKNAFVRSKKSALDMIRNVQLKSVVDDFEFILGFTENKADNWELFIQSLEFIERFAEKNNKKIICAFDEFGDLAKFDRKEDIIKMIRSYIQRQERTTYIFSGSYESVMASMFLTSKSPFYRFARIMRLGYLDHELVSTHIQKKLNSVGIKIDRATAREYTDLTKGHPYYSQLILQQIVLFHAVKGSIPSSETLLLEILAVEKDYLEKTWEGLSSNREYIFILQELTVNPTGIYGKARKRGINGSRALNKLEGMGILYREDKGYHFYDPIFELWIANSMV